MKATNATAHYFGFGFAWRHIQVEARQSWRMHSPICAKTAGTLHPLTIAKPSQNSLFKSGSISHDRPSHHETGIPYAACCGSNTVRKPCIMTYELSSIHSKHQDPNLCCKLVFGEWRSHQCKRKRGYGPEEAYCKTHDPVAIKAKDDARSAKWADEWAEAEAKRKLASHAQSFLDALRLIANGHNAPRSLAIEAIKDFPTPVVVEGV
jgi:hypothetical protein